MLFNTSIKVFVLLFILSIQSPLHAQYKVYTQDVVHFWEAFDSVQTTSDKEQQIAIIQRLYVDRATIGLKEFMELRGGKPEYWQDMMERNKEGLERIRPMTLSVLEQKPVIDEKLERLKALYPDFKPADVYFTIGIGNTGGTVKENHVLIGCEVVASDKEDWAVPIVMHEFIHTQQQAETNGHLLAHCIHEGMADFLSELTLDRPLAEIHPGGYIDFGLRNEQEVWKDFKKYMPSTVPHNYFGWLYSGRVVNKQKLNDLGYYMGYHICKSYYEKATDKEQAVKDMITLDLKSDENARAFLLKSGYVPDRDIRYVKNMEFGKIKVKEVKTGRKKIVGYKAKGDQVVFRLKLPKHVNPEEVNFIHVAGTFNGWNPQAEGYKMDFTGKGKYELTLPKSQLTAKETPEFKFVVNGDNWLPAPQNAKNVEKGGNRNLLLTL